MFYGVVCTQGADSVVFERLRPGIQEDAVDRLRVVLQVRYVTLWSEIADYPDVEA